MFATTALGPCESAAPIALDLLFDLDAGDVDIDDDAVWDWDSEDTEPERRVEGDTVV